MEIWCFCNSNLVSSKGFNGILFPLTIFYSSKLNFSNKQKFDQNFFFVILQQLVLSFSEIKVIFTRKDCAIQKQTKDFIYWMHFQETMCLSNLLLGKAFLQSSCRLGNSYLRKAEGNSTLWKFLKNIQEYNQKNIISFQIYLPEERWW